MSAWNGHFTANLDAEGERGITLLFSPGDTRDEFRQPTNMLLNIECDPTVHTVEAGDIYVQPPDPLEPVRLDYALPVNMLLGFDSTFLQLIVFEALRRSNS